ncbi:MAG: helix-turn-helix transcriptional regulator [Clostridia bacterium]|nr:helix-turn-helix transcriptional regulator [Clostridia bacterium]
MDISKLLKDVRQRLQMGQVELAEALGVSFATVNRWENGHFKPTPVALRALKQFCREKGIDYAQYDETEVQTLAVDLVLYCAKPRGELCDELFLDDYTEASAIAAEEGCLIEASLQMEEAKVATLSSAADFLFYNAFFRKMLTEADAPARFERYTKLKESCDLIVTYGITRDLSALLARFYRGEITDRALGACLSLYTAGQGYLLVSERARASLVLRHTYATDKAQGEDSDIAEVLKKYRREGYYFDEIVDTEKDRRR